MTADKSEPETEGEVQRRRRTQVKPFVVPELPNARGLRQWISLPQKMCLAASNRSKRAM